MRRSRCVSLPEPTRVPYIPAASSSSSLQHRTTGQLPSALSAPAACIIMASRTRQLHSAAAGCLPRAHALSRTKRIATCPVLYCTALLRRTRHISFPSPQRSTPSISLISYFNCASHTSLLSLRHVRLREAEGCRGGQGVALGHHGVRRHLSGLRPRAARLRARRRPAGRRRAHAGERSKAEEGVRSEEGLRLVRGGGGGPRGRHLLRRLHSQQAPRARAHGHQPRQGGAGGEGVHSERPAGTAGARRC